MKPWEANLMILETAAEGLRPILDGVYFVGGATTVLYIDPSKRSSIRSTEDVDCVVQIESNLEFSRLERKLEAMGFTHDIRKGAPICRWLYRGIKVDVMPSRSEVLGFSNRWYENGIRFSQDVSLNSGLKIKTFSFPYFLASKLAAFRDRGDSDYFASKDLEDVVSVLDGREEALQGILTSHEDVLRYLKEQFNELSNDELFIQSLAGQFADHDRPEEGMLRLIDLLRSL